MKINISVEQFLFFNFILDENFKRKIKVKQALIQERHRFLKISRRNMLWLINYCTLERKSYYLIIVYNMTSVLLYNRK